MVVGIYSIKDYHTGFSTPTFEVNDASAMRNFANACLREESLLHNFSDDFELFKIGTFDSDTGVIYLDKEDFFPVCKASDYVKREVMPNV